MPETLPDPEPVGPATDATLPELAARLLLPFVGEAIGDTDLRRVAADALDFPVPLVRLDESTAVLELFHGPTGSFKDVGARFLARTLAALRGPQDRRVGVLVATSGDTGGAAARAFLGAPGVETVILFPEGRVSPVQLRQMTGAGGNVRAVAVRGSFDDCQRLVKGALGDVELRETVALTTANSINLARFFPQAAYYFHAVARLGDVGLGEVQLGAVGSGGAEPDAIRSAPGSPGPDVVRSAPAIPGPDVVRSAPASPSPDVVRSAPASPSPVVSVPCGNLGNLAAGVLARRLGLPVHRFVAATNTNDAAVRFLATGRMDPVPSRPTLSSAMDISLPSNLERLLHLFGGDVDAMRREVTGSAHDDPSTLEAMRTLRRRTGYLADPHTAVGWLGLEALAREEGLEGRARILVATAHPAKFPDAVERATGERPRPPAVWEVGREGSGPPATLVRIAPDPRELRSLLTDPGPLPSS